MATKNYLRCGGVVNNQIEKVLLMSLSVKIFFKSVNMWQSYKQERACLMHFLRNLAVWRPGAHINWLRFDRITAMSLWPFWPTLYIYVPVSVCVPAQLLHVSRCMGWVKKVS